MLLRPEVRPPVTYILESLEAAPPVTLATRSWDSSTFKSSSCLSSSSFFLPRRSRALILACAQGRVWVKCGCLRLPLRRPSPPLHLRPGQSQEGARPAQGIQGPARLRGWAVTPIPQTGRRRSPAARAPLPAQAGRGWRKAASGGARPFRTLPYRPGWQMGPQGSPCTPNPSLRAQQRADGSRFLSSHHS